MSAEYEYNQQTLTVIRYACNYIYIYIIIIYICACLMSVKKKKEKKKKKRKRKEVLPSPSFYDRHRAFIVQIRYIMYL